MRSFFKTFVFAFLSVLLLAPLSPSTVHAQQSAGVQIQPAIIEEGLAPGAILEETLTIRNISSSEQTYYLLHRDITGVASNNQPVFAEEGAEQTGYEMSSWIEVSEEPIVLQPGAAADVPVTIRVPDTATPGSHFAGLFVTMTPPRLRATGAAVGYEVGTIISIRIAGEANEVASIRSFSTDKLVYSSPKVTFSTRVENGGNVLVRPRGPLEIRNMFGKKVETLVVNDTLGGVFPGSIRAFDVTWDSKDFAIGRYQGIVALIYGEDGHDTTIASTISFWVLPLNVILPILGILVLIVVVVYFGVRLHIRRTLERYQVPTRRGSSYRSRGRGVTRLSIVAVTLLTVTALFLIALLFLVA